MRRLAERISRPVEHLAESTTRLAAAKYDWPVPHTARRDEVGPLARAFDHARGSIQQQLVEIDEMGAARQKLESELSIARDIQLAMLPRGATLRARRPAPAGARDAGAGQGGRRRFLHASSSATTRAVVRDRRCVRQGRAGGAVHGTRDDRAGSGHRTSAARPTEALPTRRGAWSKATTPACSPPCCAGWSMSRSGELTLASAGHEPPVLLHADGRWSSSQVGAGRPAGRRRRRALSRSGTAGCEPGDALVAYTDGITEAFDGRQSRRSAANACWRR